MRISWVVPTYNEEKVINNKLENLINFCNSHPVFHESEFIVTDNGSIDNTVCIANSFKQVTVMEFGRVGKYQAVHQAVAKLDSDWIILSDANVLLRSADSDSLNNLFQIKDVTLVYGLIRRANKSYVSSVQEPLIKTPKRLILDVWLGFSSGAYGGLYAIRTSVLKKAISLPPVQNDDYFIAVSATQYGVPKIGYLYAEEIESMSFRDEFKRKMRDAQGHIHAIIEINRRVKNIRSKWYGISIRLLIWLAIITFLAFNIFLLFTKPALVVGFAPILFFTKVRIFYARSLGFFCGFFSGPLLTKKITWDTFR